MNETLRQVFGIVSSVTLIVAMIPYLRDIKHGHTKPQKMSQIIFCLIALLSVIAQIQKGAGASVYMSILFVIFPIYILYLSRRDSFGSPQRFDYFMLGVVSVILGVWFVTDSAIFAIILLTVANFIGKVLVAIKVFRFPETEFLPTWLFSVLASIFAAVAVGSWDAVLLLPPVHNGMTVLAIAAIIIVRRRKLAL